MRRVGVSRRRCGQGGPLARNLALAEGARPGPGPADLIAACAGCYRAMLSTQRTLADDGALAARVGGALSAAGLRYEGRGPVVVTRWTCS